MWIKRIAVLLSAALLLCFCGCSETPPQGPDAYDTQAASQVRDQNHRYLTLWSWQIPTQAEAQAYAQQAVDCGFTAVDLGVQWSAFEPLEGHFEWTWLDSAVKAFTDKGLAVSLQPLLWSKDLTWAEDLAFQETPAGVFAEEGRGSFISFTDANTLAVVKNTLQNFALHASTNYGPHLTRWGVRLSCFGEFDYSVSEDLDYSPSSAIAFRSYLRERYATWEELNNAHGLGVSSWEDLDRIPVEELVEACPVEWRLCRQKALLDLLDLTCGLFRSADSTVPVVFHLGTYGNGMNNAYSGIVDLWSAVSGSDFDILSVTFSNDVDPGMMLSMVSSFTSKKLSVEVDGAGVWENGDSAAAEDAVKKQVETCGKYGVFSISTANFTVDQLEENKDLLKSYEGLLSSDDTIAAADPSKAVLIFTNGILQVDVPDGYDVFYDEIWNTLSENGTRRVRFMTDVQLASKETSLEGVSDLYSGELSGDVTVDVAFGEVFMKTQATLHGAVNPVLPDGTALTESLEGFSSRVTEE